MGNIKLRKARKSGKNSMKRMMEQIGETVKGRIADAKLTSLEDQIRKYILKEFARNSRPPTPKEIMEGLGISSEDIVNQTIQKLQRADILSKEGSKIISAYPFSAIETAYKVTFEEGHEVYALCAADALGIHFMLDKDIIIVSRCPECRREIKIEVKNGQITTSAPKGIIEFVSRRDRGSCIAETLCPFINFFCSKEDLKKWQERNPEYGEGKTYSLDEALELSKIVFGDLLK